MLNMKYIIKSKLYNNQGSMIVESAIIFPIILVVLFSIITATIVLYDHFVTEMGLTVLSTINNTSILGEEKNKDRSYESQDLLDKLRIGNLEDLSVTVQKDPNRIEYFCKKYVMKIVDNTEYPFRTLPRFTQVKELTIYELNMMSLIYKIELVSDIFETLEISKNIKDGYLETIDTIFGALESY